MTCPLEIPKCKRSIMTTSKPFEKKGCPLNEKPTCALSPPSCPLLPQQENKCGYAKLMGVGGDVDVSQCPCKSCFLNPGCPISLNKPPPGDKSKMVSKWPDKIPPCLLCADGGNETVEQESKVSSPVEQVATQPVVAQQEKSQLVKCSSQPKSTQIVPKCSLTSSPRPLPCSDCIVEELSNDCEGKKKTCPYLVLADVCGKNCYCPEVPSVETGPPCPFGPKPCPCCATPRCPLSRKPDCVLQPKPPCCLQSPTCLCGTCPIPKPSCSPCSFRKCLGCLPTCKPLCGLSPCCCGLCSPCLPICKPLCGLNPCCCGLCSPCLPICKPSCGLNPCCCGLCSPCLPICKPLCGLNPCCCGLCSPCLPICKPLCGLNPCCCGLCSPCLPICKPLCGLNPCCQPCSQGPPSCPLSSSVSPCPTTICNCGKCSSPCNPNLLCPLVNSCCSNSPPSCPLVSSSGCSCDSPLPCCIPCCSSPSCIPCLLKKVECILNPCSCPLKSICPPIPPPCSLKNQTNSSNATNDNKETVDRTFHLPTCPSYEPPCETHRSVNGVCPFAPNPCPISSDCPFPVKLSSENNEGQKQNINKEGDLPSLSKTVKIDGQITQTVNEPQSVKNQKPQNGNGNVISNSRCPNSTCGVTPSPECPAAKILCPEIYKKPKKPEKKICPLKKCMTKEGCPLSNIKPHVSCPTGDVSDCPFAQEPDCPLEELANRCSCACIDPFACCNVCPPCIPCACPCTTTDGCSRSILATRLSKSKGSTPNSISNSNSTFESPSHCSSLTFNNEYIFLSKSTSKENKFSSLNSATSSLSSLNQELLQFDGCCALNKFRNDSLDLASSSSVNSDCPFESLAPKTICPLAPPKCPLTPKPTTCPLTRKPDPCPLSSGGELICPVKFPSCKKFPEGRCPMGDLNVCECDYPVSPCLLPLQDPNLIAPPQYCFREDCCMGLPFPPLERRTVEGDIDTGPFYQFKDTKPGKEETKHYVEILKDPPDGEISLFGMPRKRLHDNWTIVKYGEGYLRCKTIAKKLEEMGPHENVDTQYDAEDCPLDEETRLILENRKKHLRDKKELENLKLSLGFRPTEKKKKKN